MGVSLVLLSVFMYGRALSLDARRLALWGQWARKVRAGGWEDGREGGREGGWPGREGGQVLVARVAGRQTVQRWRGCRFSCVQPCTSLPPSLL